MGQLDNLPDNTEPENPKAAEQILRSMTHDLRSLQQDLIAQLHQDVQRLQTEKSRLISDIEKLQNQQQLLQSERDVSLSRQQLAQQQAWAKQLALALANHLQVALTQRLSQTITAHPIQRAVDQQTVDVSQIAISQQTDPESTYRLLASIDETIGQALASMRHDLSSYQSALSQQIGRMHDLGQQGEAILDVLVNRISQQLQAEVLKQRGDRMGGDRSGVPSPSPNTAPLASASPIAPSPYPSTPSAPQFPPVAPAAPESLDYSEYSNYPDYSNYSEYSNDSAYAPPESSSSSSGSQVSSATPVPHPQSEEELDIPEDLAVSPPEPVPTAPRSPARRSPFQVGLILILFSTATLALHHVIVQIIGTPGRLFGSDSLQVGGFIPLDRLSSAMLVFWVRMVAIVPLMAWLSGLLYRPVWRDFKAFLVSKDRRLLWSLIGSGVFLMLSQVFLYIAIGQLGPAVGVTISSLYPLVTILLMWMLFGDRPTRLRVFAGLAILLGVFFTVFTAQSALPDQGLTAALISGGTFALYLTAMAIINRRKLNPVPISLIQNATMFVLSSIWLIGGRISAPPSNWTGLILAGLTLGGLTIVSYILSDVGSRILGAARATLITASVPALTALLAFLILPGTQNLLGLGQIIGILIVTLGMAGLSFERVLNQYKAARQGR